MSRLFSKMQKRKQIYVESYRFQDEFSLWSPPKTIISRDQYTFHMAIVMRIRLQMWPVRHHRSCRKIFLIENANYKGWHFLGSLVRVYSKINVSIDIDQWCKDCQTPSQWSLAAKPISIKKLITTYMLTQQVAFEQLLLGDIFPCLVCLRIS